jgi:hypothetical protein
MSDVHGQGKRSTIVPAWQRSMLSGISATFPIAEARRIKPQRIAARKAFQARAAEVASHIREARPWGSSCHDASPDRRPFSKIEHPLRMVLTVWVVRANAHNQFGHSAAASGAAKAKHRPRAGSSFE